MVIKSIELVLLICCFAGLSNAFVLPCKPVARSKIIPAKASLVRPSDIKVIMGIGDSITAGFGQQFHKIGDYVGESRGASWSMGGDKEQPTVPNFFKQIGANIVGQSHGRTMPYLHFLPKSVRPGLRDFSSTQLNAAESQAGLEDVFEQIEYLETHIRQMNPSVDIDHDWKVLNYFMGSNDICEDAGKDQVWENSYFNTLLQLRNKFPRLIVNVFLLPDVSQMGMIGKNTESCRILRNTIGFCSFSKEEGNRKIMKERQVKYNRIIVEASERINRLYGNESFAVVVQPVLSLSEIRREHTSDFDCFHLNEFGSRLVAVGVWNNIISRKDQKLYSVNDTVTPLCPTDETYLVG